MEGATGVRCGCREKLLDIYTITHWWRRSWMQVVHQVVQVVLVPTILPVPRVGDVNVVVQVACGKHSTSSWACATTGTGTGLLNQPIAGQKQVECGLWFWVALISCPSLERTHINHMMLSCDLCVCQRIVPTKNPVNCDVSQLCLLFIAGGGRREVWNHSANHSRPVTWLWFEVGGGHQFRC